jgi:hypothetical protein
MQGQNGLGKNMGAPGASPGLRHGIPVMRRCIIEKTGARSLYCGVRRTDTREQDQVLNTSRRARNRACPVDPGGRPVCCPRSIFSKPRARSFLWTRRPPRGSPRLSLHGGEKVYLRGRLWADLSATRQGFGRRSQAGCRCACDYGSWQIGRAKPTDGVGNSTIGGHPNKNQSV